MMQPPLEPKVTTESKDYGINWAPEIADTELTIDASLWTIVGGAGSPDLTVENHGIVEQRTVVRLAGGEPGRDYTLENTITLSNGEELTDAIEVCVRTSAEKAGIY